MTTEESQLREIFQRLGLRREAASVLLSSGESLFHEFDVSPEEFLQQAEDDFEAGGP
jgi:hypothetical protein